MKYLWILVSLSATLYYREPLLDQIKKFFTEPSIHTVFISESVITGAGKPIEGNGTGEWQSDCEGVINNHPNPESGLQKISPKESPGIIINYSLLPLVNSLLDLHLKEVINYIGEDKNYYPTGTSGNNILAWAKAVEK